MLSLATRKISGHCFAFAVAALLIHSTGASAGVVADGQAQARLLLTGSTAAVMRSSTTLSGSDAAASDDAQDQARRLLTGAVAALPTSDRGEAGGALPMPLTQSRAAYAGANHSARRMILGKDA